MEPQTIFEEFNETIQSGEITYDEVIYFAKYANKQVKDALWKAWNGIGVYIFPMLSENNIVDETLTPKITKFYFYKLCKIENADFYNELANRVQMFYTSKLDIMIHGKDECIFELKKGEYSNICGCGKDRTRNIQELQNVFQQLTN